MFYTTNFRILPTENYYTYLFRQSRAKQVIMILFFHRMILDPKISCINIPIYSARYISVWIHFDNSTFNSRSQKLFQITIWHETKNTTECLTTLNKNLIWFTNSHPDIIVKNQQDQTWEWNTIVGQLHIEFIRCMFLSKDEHAKTRLEIKPYWGVRTK